MARKNPLKWTDPASGVEYTADTVQELMELRRALAAEAPPVRVTERPAEKPLPIAPGMVRRLSAQELAEREQKEMFFEVSGGQRERKPRPMAAGPLPDGFSIEPSQTRDARGVVRTKYCVFYKGVDSGRYGYSSQSARQIADALEDERIGLAKAEAKTKAKAERAAQPETAGRVAPAPKRSSMQKMLAQLGETEEVVPSSMEEAMARGWGVKMNGKKVRKNPSYTPVKGHYKHEAYGPDPSMANWTSYAPWAQEQFYRANPGKPTVKKKRNRIPCVVHVLEIAQWPCTCSGEGRVKQSKKVKRMSRSARSSNPFGRRNPWVDEKMVTSGGPYVPQLYPDWAQGGLPKVWSAKNNGRAQRNPTAYELTADPESRYVLGATFRLQMTGEGKGFTLKKIKQEYSWSYNVEGLPNEASFSSPEEALEKAAQLEADARQGYRNAREGGFAERTGRISSGTAAALEVLAAESALYEKAAYLADRYIPGLDMLRPDRTMSRPARRNSVKQAAGDVARAAGRKAKSKAKALWEDPYETVLSDVHNDWERQRKYRKAFKVVAPIAGAVVGSAGGPGGTAGGAGAGITASGALIGIEDLIDTGFTQLGRKPAVANPASKAMAGSIRASRDKELDEYIAWYKAEVKRYTKDASLPLMRRFRQDQLDVALDEFDKRKVSRAAKEKAKVVAAAAKEKAKIKAAKAKATAKAKKAATKAKAKPNPWSW